ncbi:hypothetical protein [Sphingomonas melonis]|uniref:hypothetical protein n=1 Tax=Sphingomonas melonis TaxID=152682 RepID=UPI000A955FA7|nr:hypothetical protein [Sphingomonas melonis]
MDGPTWIRTTSVPGRNALGYADHRPFTGIRSELVYGQQADGTLVHIDHVPRGLACACICPACGEVLIAYKGRIKTPYFGHGRGGASGCGRGAETNAHIWAKEVLEREKCILLPAVSASYGKLERIVHQSKMFMFAEARLERTLGDIVPDVILRTEKGDELLVEVHVTHACGDEKIAKLKERCLPTVEVHLGQWRTSQDREEIEAALLTAAPRNWLYNRKIEDAEAELVEEAAARAARAERERLRREQERQERERRDAEKEANGVAAAIRRALDAARSAAAQRRAAADPPTDRPDGGRVVTFPIPSFGFLAPSAVWQRRIYDRCIDDHQTLALTDGAVTPAQAAQAVRDLIHQDLTKPLEPQILASLRDRGVLGAAPHEAIDHYLDRLYWEGLLVMDASGRLKLGPEQIARLEQRRLAEQARDRRRRSLARSWRTIAEHLGGEADDVEVAWCAKLGRERGIDLDQLIERGGPAWDAFDQALLAVENMIAADGQPAGDLLCLPLEAELALAQERAQAALDKVRRGRVEELRSRALGILGPETEAWLSCPLPNGSSPTALAERGDAGLFAAIDCLRDAGRARDARIAAESLAKECRFKLRSAAPAALGAERANLFLRGHHPRLGAPPETYCVDERTLAVCLSLLGGPAGAPTRGKRR